MSCRVKVYNVELKCVMSNQSGQCRVKVYNVELKCVMSS